MEPLKTSHMDMASSRSFDGIYCHRVCQCMYMEGVGDICTATVTKIGDSKVLCDENTKTRMRRDQDAMPVETPSAFRPGRRSRRSHKPHL